MPRHNLKIHPEYFQPVHDHLKLAELRKDDRSPPMSRHDELLLEEFDPEQGMSGRKVLAKVTHASRGNHIPKGLVLLSIEVTECSCCGPVAT